MATTIIHTNAVPFKAASAGLEAEILNRELCGATYSHGTLRLLQAGENFETASDRPMHQLIYFLEGDGIITVDAARYDVSKGGGAYLAPSETAKIEQAGPVPLKFFHLTVLKATDS
jgi:glyoxylate utilization-related uncharacterized protein